MIAWRYIFFAIIGALLAGCAPSRSDRVRLERAEAIVRQYPDSALSILDSITPKSLQNKEFGARAAIVEAEAAYQQSRLLASDSLLNAVIDFYRVAPDSPRRLRAFYLRGYQNYLAQRYANALVDYLTAEQTAKSLADSITLGLIYRAMANIYYQINDFNSSLAYFKKSKDIFNSGTPNVYSLESIIILGIAYFNAYKYDDCIATLTPLLDLEENLTEDERANIQSQILCACVNKHDYEEAERYLEELNPASNLWNSELFVQNAGEIAYNNGDEADFLRYKELLNKINPENQWLEFLDARRRSDYKTSFELLDEFYQDNHDFVVSWVANDIRLLANEFLDGQNARLISERKHRSQVFTFTIVILLLIIVLLIVYLCYRRARQEAKFAHQMQQIQYLVADLKSKEQALDALNAKELEKANKPTSDIYAATLRLPRQFDALAKLCEIYYQHQNSPGLQKKIFTELNAIIECFKYDNPDFRHLEQFIDDTERGLFTRFKTDYPTFKADDYQLFVFIVLGFSPAVISTVTGIYVDKLYSKKGYLKKRIMNTECESKSEYLAHF